MPGTSPKSRQLIALAAAVAVAAVLSGAAAWLVAGPVLGLAKPELALVVSLGTTAGAILAGTFGQPLFSAGLLRLLQVGEPPGPGPEELERWCTLVRTAVLQRRVLGGRSQREQMLRRGVLLELPVLPELDLRRGRNGRPRVRAGGPTEPWSRLVEHWSLAAGRLVIVGDPGYGKTFAALALIAHINRGEGEVAELFPLADWYAWSAGRSSPTIEEWLVHQLTQGYPDLTPAAAWAIVMQGRLVPVFDGLDEVPQPARAECRDALEAYAGRTEPFRPLVVTCRQEEYFELAPRWVGADRHVALVGLRSAEIAALLRARFGDQGRWAGVLAAIEAGDRPLTDLLRSPLRLAAAIDVYERRDPQELMSLARRPRGGEELWDLLLGLGRPAFGQASDEDIRRWLAFVAASLRSHARQRFWLHELYLYAAPRDRRRFYLFSSLLITVPFSVPLLLTGSAFGTILAVAFVAVGVLGYRHDRDRPMEHAVRGTPSPAAYLRMVPRALVFGLFWATAAALISFAVLLLAYLVSKTLGEARADIGTAAWLLLQLAGLLGLFAGMACAALAMAAVGSSYVAEEPPSHFAGRGPKAVMRATRNHGFVAAGFAIAIASVPGVLLVDNLAGLCVVLGMYALFLGWLGGWNAWAFHHWLRWRLARAGLLPWRLERFLEWVAEETGWLRESDAYEFRHKELLDHLAREGEPVGVENVSWDELLVRRDLRGRALDEACRGDRLMRRHEYERARDAYLAAAETAPGNARLQRSLSLVFRRLGHRHEQLRAATAAVRSDPDGAENHTALCIAYDEAGDTEAALARARRAARLGPERAQHHLNHAILLEKMGWRQSAVGVLEGALELDLPEDRELRELWRLMRRRSVEPGGGRSLELRE